jgi:ribosome biogenesis protein Nip4
MKKILDYYGAKMDLEGYDLIKIKKEIYLVRREMVPFIKNEVVAAGILVRNPELSLAFASKIARSATKNTLTVNERGETLFLYGRDIFTKNVLSGDRTKGKKLVLNKKNGCLGIGFWDGEMIKNIKDRGIFLRSLD